MKYGSIEYSKPVFIWVKQVCTLYILLNKYLGSFSTSNIRTNTQKQRIYNLL